MKIRTPTLLCVCAIFVFLASCALPAWSQTVFSDNSAGYVNKVVPKGFSLLANPLYAMDDRVPAIFSGSPDGIVIYTYFGDGPGNLPCPITWQLISNRAFSVKSQPLSLAWSRCRTRPMASLSGGLAICYRRQT